MSNNGSDMSSKKRVLDFWDMPAECFACGVPDGYRVLARCHIIPKQELAHGPNENYHKSCENLHMLCTVCHTESETLSGASYLQWFVLKRQLYSKGRLNINNFDWDSLDSLDNLDKLINMSKRRVSWGKDKNYVGDCDIELNKRLVEGYKAILKHKRLHKEASQ